MGGRVVLRGTRGLIFPNAPYRTKEIRVRLQMDPRDVKNLVFAIPQSVVLVASRATSL